MKKCMYRMVNAIKANVIYGIILGKRNIPILLLCICLLAGCGDKDSSKVVFTTGLSKDEIFRIGDEVCKEAEMQVFLMTTRYQYERVYGDQIWNTSLDGVTLEDSVKELALEKAAQLKTMYLLAQDRGIQLEEGEKKLAEAAAKEYCGRLSKERQEELGISQDTMTELYTEYAMANKVYREIIRDVNPEISDDEARIVTVQHILIKTYTKDAQGNRVDFLTADKQAAYEEACEVRELAAEGSKSFEELASRYSQDSTLTYTFGRGEMSAAFETAAFSLEKDQISQVVESDSGYHIIKCLNTFDEQETADNKKSLLEKRRSQVFQEEYDTFVEALARKLNQSSWQDMGLSLGSAVPQVDFFEIYERVFG